MSSRIIGLTGGIGMGKTTVSNYLANRYRLPILDADRYARDAVAPGSPVLDHIVDRYGQDILQPDSTLDRRRLGNIVFNDPDERRWLERQIHPVVREAMQRDQDRLSPGTVVLVIPLLFEAKLTHLVTEVWVVYCSESQQLDRLMQRENLTLEQAQARIKSQMPIQEKCDRADVVLDNSASLDELWSQIDRAMTTPSLH